MKLLVPFPKCTHPEEPQKVVETSYEYFEYACGNCFEEWETETLRQEIKIWKKAGAILELNSSGTYSVFVAKERPSGRADGRWIVRAIRPSRLSLWEEL